jgi:hypothetical protein
MKAHVTICTPPDDDACDAAANAPTPQPRKRARTTSTLDSFVVKTSKSDKDELDELLAEVFFSTNTAFKVIEHPSFAAFMDKCRPGYKLPTRHELSGPLLDKVHNKMQKVCENKLKDKTVCMSLDGWSNVHNEPIICAAVTDSNGDTYVTDTIDTSGNRHDMDYLSTVAQQCISKAETKYGCHVGSFVTDNARNMKAMRRNLAADESMHVITYACGSHQLNLLAKDLEIPNIAKHVIRIIKYFRNTHLPASWYKATGGMRLPLPLDVRWNSLCDSLSAYLKNWSKLLTVCEEHRDDIDPEIARLIKDMAIKRNCEDHVRILKPIAVALDCMQASDCSIADSVEIWKDLEEALQPILSSADYKNKFVKRKTNNLTANHYLAYLLNPKFAGARLNKEELDQVFEYLSNTNPNFLATVMDYKAQRGVFLPYRFKDCVVRNVNTMSWWDTVDVSSDFLLFVKALMTAVSSSASIERVFSTFGLVHSKLRNRLGVEKAGKLVFIYRVMNSICVDS